MLLTLLLLIIAKCQQLRVSMIKIFPATADIAKLTKEINNFEKEHKIKDIKYSCSSVAYGLELISYYTVMVVYE